MAIKVDLEKAYDGLQWEFLRETLSDIGCPHNYLQMVQCCVSSVRMRMLWSGQVLDAFISKKRVHQGDPIFPYHFVLCLEYLIHLINLVVDNKTWKPIQLNKGAPLIPHLAFADDILLFAEASVDQIDVIKIVLNLFCESSGDKVSDQKSYILFSNNVNWQTKHDIVTRSGFHCTNDLGKYLGVMILHKNVSQQTFSFILDKVNSI